MLRSFVDERLLFGGVAVWLVFMLTASLIGQPGYALWLVAVWTASLILGARARRAYRALRGEALVRFRTPDYWSNGFVLGAVTFWIFTAVAVPDLDGIRRSAIFLIGSVFYYSAGKFGCWRFGCCSHVRDSGDYLPKLPLIEATICAIGGGVAFVLTGLNHEVTAVLIAGATYSGVRFLSLWRRREIWSGVAFIDLALSYGCLIYVAVQA